MDKWKERIQTWIQGSASVPEKNQMFIIVLIGVILMVCAIPSKTMKQPMIGQKENEIEQIPSSAVYEEYMEKKISHALKHVEGIGENEVILTLQTKGKKEHGFLRIEQEQVPEVEGVVVIMEGGQDPLLRKHTMEAIQALFGIEAHKIKIMKRIVQ